MDGEEVLRVEQRLTLILKRHMSFNYSLSLVQLTTAKFSSNSYCLLHRRGTLILFLKNIKKHVLPAPSARHSRRPTRASGTTPRRGRSCRTAGSLRGGSAGSLRTRCGRRLRPRVACFPPRCLNKIPQRSGPWYIYYINSLYGLLLRIVADDDFASDRIL